MNAALLVYDDLTLLDLVGFYDPLSRLGAMDYVSDLCIDFCTYYDDPRDHYGFPLKVDQRRPDLSGYDLVFVPGGFGTRQLMLDSAYIKWIQTAAPVGLKVSVCTGALLLGAAGFLQNRRATTHFDEYATLAQYGAKVIDSEIVVEDADCITGGAVASSIALGLYLCKKLAGSEAELQIKRRMGL